MSDDNAVSTEAEEREPGSTHTSAQELGDITAQRLQGGLRKLAQTVGTEGDGVDYYRFTLSEAREVRLGLKLRQGEAELYLEDAEGNVLARSMAHAGYEAAVRTLLPGTYYVRVEAVGAAASEYEFRYGVLEANASFRPASDSPWHTGLAERMGMPSFGEAGYAFELSETVDGRVSGVLLGRVLAVDPNGEELSYRIVGGNGSGLFALGGASGELSYVGAGEDFEGGAGSYELTIRVSDGTHTIDTTVTVTITDAAEAPAFGEGSYAFALTENVDGSVSRVLLGVVEATDPDSDAVRYSLLGGNDSSLFAIEETSGELFYVGAGEDFEGGVTSYELTIRASDGTHTIDTTVTVTVTDAAEQPAFGDGSYAFELAENADGRANGLSLGRVLATDPDGDEVRYSLTGGNELFTVDETSGELYYVGPGEDYESGVTSYEVTVRASDAAHTVDTTVTVTVTDAAEAPAFGEESYAFELAENVDGSVNRISLGLVAATDPDGDSVRYSLTGSNDSSLFVIGAASGELYYVGGGEDFEGGVTSYELTVRASDAAHTVDTAVTVTVTDAAEAPAFGEESYAFELAENVDGRANGLSLGSVTATDPDSDTVRYSLLGGNDSSLFAIEETSGELFYVGAGEDFEGGVTSYEVTVRASDGTHTIDTTVTVTVTDAAEAPAFGDESYAFELAENADGRANRLSLGRVLATDPDGDEVRYSLTGGNESMLFNIDETSGELYYVGPGEDYESGVTSYELTVRASDAAHTVDTTVTVTVTDAAEAPAFGEESYAFELAENVDGRVNRLSLGTVTATDPDSDAVRYSLLDGNDSSLFAIEETSGELYYVGGGEDFEGGVTSYELTIRASDGTHTIDTTVTVTVTDAAEQPAFGEESYAFELAENADGRANGLSLGRVTATDPDGDAVRYSLAGGNESMLFNIDETSGELYYVGPGEDYESGVTSYELTVRASDAAHTVDTTVTVTVTDAAEAPAFGEESYAFELAENVDGRVNRLSLGAVTATDPDSDGVRYSLVGGNDSSLFAIEETSGELFYVGAGEDFEGGVTSYELTIRASDGTHTIDTTVTVTVTDAAEAPAFGDGSYAFELAENADGLSLGRVTATDPDGDAVRYSLTGGNELFNIDETSGELYYVGPGEDYESGVTSYEVTVRASDAAHTVDTTVTVTVTDEAEAPAFGEESYAFELAENVDGRVNWISLGAVTATDPDSDTVRYSLVGGNDSDLFAIGETSGELYYVGPGEDYEGGVTSYELTVRASDGTHASDTTVKVALGDVRGRSEPEGGDLPNDRTTTGMVLVDEGAVTGNIEMWWDLDWFAVELVAGRTYQIDFRGQPTGDGTLVDPFLYGVFDGDGRLIPGTTIPDGGTSHNSRLVFTAPREGTYYIATSGNGTYPSGTGTYELEVRDVRAPVFAEAGYRFALSENAEGSVNRQSLGTVTATDPDGGTVRYRLVGGDESRRFAIDPDTGEVFYVGLGEDYESRVTSHELTIRASDGAYSTEATVTVTVTDVAEAPAFEEERYAFALSENAEGSVNRLSLGAVAATDPDGDAVRYSLSSGNDSELFAIDETSGELYYVGLGEDYESGVTSHELTVRASDGADSTEVTVAVTVTNGAEAPAFEEENYTFELAENTDGRVNRLLLGAVTATDPDGDAVRYSLAGGIESGLFAIDAASGEFYYVGAGEDFESGVTSHELTIRASDGTHTVDATVAVTVVDDPLDFEKTTIAQGGSEPAGEDLPAGQSTRGVVSVDAEPVTGTLGSRDDHDWFAVTLAPGRTYAFILQEDTPGEGSRPVPVIRGLRDANGDPVPGIVGGAEVRFATDAAAAEALYYIEVGGGGGSGQGTSATRGIGTRSAYTRSVDTGSVGTRSSNDHGTGYQLRANDITETRDAADDYRSDTATTATVAVGVSATGEIELGSDRDWFAVSLERGRTYRFDLEGSATDAGTLYDPHLYGIYDAAGNLIVGTTNNDSGVGLNSRVYFMATADVTYYVAAGAWGANLGTYMLSLTEVTDDFTAWTDTTGTVAVGGLATGGIQFAHDRDWFAVTLVSGKTYRFDLEGSATDAGTLSDPYLRGIYDEAGNSISGTTDLHGGAGRNSRVTYTATQNGTHYVSVSAGIFVPEHGTYRLSVWNLTGGTDDFTASTDTTGTVAVGGSVTGKIEFGGDRDWFAVTLVSGKIYGFDLEGLATGAGTLYDPYLRGIYDSAGDPIGGTTDNDRGAGRNSRVTFRATQDGIYYVSAGSNGQNQGTYKLFVTDFPAVRDTAAPVAVGGSATDRIHFGGDRDWFAVTLEAGKTYRIDLEGSATRVGTLYDPYLYGIYDAAGNPIDGTTDNDDGKGFNSRVFFTAPQAAAYYVSAGGNGQSQGTYRLSVREVRDDFTAGTDTTGTVEIGGSTRGEIEVPYDRDWFAVTLEEGRRYQFDVEGSQTGAGTLVYPYLLGVYDANGNFAFNNSGIYHYPGNYQQIYFTAPKAATYYVAATPWRVDIGTYTLSARDVTDDYAAGMDTTGRVAVDGSVTGEIEVPYDDDWFAVTLKAGRTYRIDLKGASTGDGTLDDPRLIGVRDAGGALMSLHGSHSRLLITPLGDAIYYVVAAGASYYTVVGGIGKRSHSLGTYTLSVTDVTKSAADDFAAGTGTSGTVEVGGSATGEIGSSGDRDWFAVDLVAGKTYRIDLEGTATGAGSLNDPYLPGVYDADGNLIGVTTDNDNGAGRNSRVYFTAAADVTHYVAAAAFAYSLGTYTLSVTDVTDSITDDLAVATGTSDAVEVGGSATGEIETSGDRDRFAVTLEAGKIYRIDLEGSATGAGTLDDPYLLGVYQYWTNGIVSGTRFNDGGVGLNSRVYFTAPAHGIYYVTAGAWEDGVGSYTLSVTDVTDSFTDDFAAGTGTSGEVEVGGSVTGEIGYGGDRDWFAMTLETGRTYRIDLEGLDTGAGTLADPFLLGVHDANGNLIGSVTAEDYMSVSGRILDEDNRPVLIELLGGTTNNNSGVGLNSRVYFTATAEATYPTYYVAAGAWEADIGTYTLSVTDVTDDFAAGTGTSGTVDVGGTATGEIEISGDRDWFAVTLGAGKTYRIDLEGTETGAGTLRDPYLRGVHDAEGNLLDGTTNDDGGTGYNSQVTFAADAPGIYYVAAGADAYGEGTYTLSVEEVTDGM